MRKIVYAIGEISSETQSWIDAYNVDVTFIDDNRHEKTRPKFKETIISLSPGDELIVTKFSNAVRGLPELTMLLEVCKLRSNRIISVEDRIDTKDVIFKPLPTENLLDVISRLPQEIIKFRQSLGEEKRQKASCAASSKKAARMKRDQRVVSLYLAGHSIDMIMDRTGIKHSHLYNILKRNGVGRDRIARKSGVICE